MSRPYAWEKLVLNIPRIWQKKIYNKTFATQVVVLAADDAKLLTDLLQTPIITIYTSGLKKMRTVIMTGYGFVAQFSKAFGITCELSMNSILMFVSIEDLLEWKNKAARDQTLILS